MHGLVSKNAIEGDNRVTPVNNVNLAGLSVKVITVNNRFLCNEKTL